ncbi:MAG: SDR family oxidoreductase [Anaerolineae bacterium]
MKTTNNQTVLVTGASGFIATHCIQQLLERGCNVHDTLRTMSRQAQVRRALAQVGGESERLQFFEADLKKDEGWETAVKDCDYVLHIASPLPTPGKPAPKDENEMIAPARNGTLRVLQAAAANGVKRVVMTSSTDAISKGHANHAPTFDESDWSNLEADIGAYARSKALAEQAAWDFVKNNPSGQKLELAVILPVLVLGPLLGAGGLSPSTGLVRMIMAGDFPAWARLHWQVVDVRDVAAAHLAVMTHPEAAGKRYCCYADGIWMPEIAEILKREFGNQGYKIPTRQMPAFIMRLLALFNPDAKMALERLNRETSFSNARLKTELNWHPRMATEMIVDTGASLIEHGIV